MTGGPWEVRCPGCGVDVSRVPPCRVCGEYCCPCVHADDAPPDVSVG